MDDTSMIWLFLILLGLIFIVDRRHVKFVNELQESINRLNGKIEYIEQGWTRIQGLKYESKRADESKQS